VWAENTSWPCPCRSEDRVLRTRYITCMNSCHCCATMTSDNSALMTYVMWRGKHLWNVSVLKRVHPCQSWLLHLVDFALPFASNNVQVYCNKFDFSGLSAIYCYHAVLIYTKLFAT
jgi:hypothetical protein